MRLTKKGGKKKTYDDEGTRKKTSNIRYSQATKGKKESWLRQKQGGDYNRGGRGIPDFGPFGRFARRKFVGRLRGDNLKRGGKGDRWLLKPKREKELHLQQRAVRSLGGKRNSNKGDQTRDTRFP